MKKTKRIRLCKTALIIGAITILAALSGILNTSLHNKTIINEYAEEESYQYHTKENFDKCAYWLAESSIPNSGLGVYAGKIYQESDTTGNGDLIIPVLPTDKTKASRNQGWKGMSDGANHISGEYFEHGTKVLNLIQLAHINSHYGLSNVEFGETKNDDAGLKRGVHPGAGAITTRYNFAYSSKKTIYPGEELFWEYGGNGIVPYLEHYEKSDIIGNRLLTTGNVEEEAWAILRELAESKVQRLLPEKLSDYKNMHYTYGKIGPAWLNRKYYEKADKIGTQLLEARENILNEIWDIIRDLAEERLRMALPDKISDYQRMKDTYGKINSARASVPNSTRSAKWLQKRGHCVDNPYVDKSTIPGAGRGAFSKRVVKKGDVLTVSPMVVLDSGAMDMIGNNLLEHVKETKKQLVLNYCFGHDDSEVLLVPYGSGVTAINHNVDKEPNVYIRWADNSQYHSKEWLNFTVDELFMQKKWRLLIEYVVLKDILPGDEIFIDYGQSWEKAWMKHTETFKPKTNVNGYTPASEYLKMHKDDPIRTTEEQLNDPYPENLHTACYFCIAENDEVVPCRDSCPCVITKREKAIVSDGGAWDWDYTGILGTNGYGTEDSKYLNASKVSAPSYCIPENTPSQTVELLEQEITIVDKQFSTDMYQPNVFRHRIHVPEGFYPEQWLRKDL